jgi:hypothetical protein
VIVTSYFFLVKSASYEAPGYVTSLNAPFPRYVDSLRSKYFPQERVPRHTETVFFTYGEIKRASVMNINQYLFVSNDVFITSLL